MFIPDMPDVPPQDTPAIIAQANQAVAGGPATMRILGVCFLAPSDKYDYSLENDANPVVYAKTYLQLYENRTVTGPAKITILQSPKHGILRLISEDDDLGIGRFDRSNVSYAYFPEGYLGTDQAVVQVEIGGMKVKIAYFFQAIGDPEGDSKKLCRDTGTRWKISSTVGEYDNRAITVPNNLPLTMLVP